MVVSFLISAAFLLLHKSGALQFSTHVQLMLTVAVTTVCWLVTAYAAPATDRATLVAFYEKVRPFGPGWERIRREAEIPKDDTSTSGQSIPLGLLGWVAGCASIWSALFAIGNFLYGRMASAVMLLLVCVFSSVVLLWVVTRLWKGSPVEAVGAPAPSGSRP